MPNIKPARLRTGKTGKEEIDKRIKQEEKIKGTSKINKQAPKTLSSSGARLYKEIIDLLPEDFLNGADTYTVGIVAEALDRMMTSQLKINQDGLFVDAVKEIEGKLVSVGTFENEAAKTYERYSKIFDKFGSKLGLSPKDRAALAVLNIKEEEEKQDPLLAILQGN